MKRRTLLQSALAMPALRIGSGVTQAQRKPQGPTLFSGMPGLDYALGGIDPGSLGVVAGPSCTGKTLMLLELAARLSLRYGQNVVFYSAHKPSVYLARKAILREDVSIHYLESTREGEWIPEAGPPGVYFVDAASAAVDGAYETALRLAHQHPSGCAAFMLDGWSSQSPPAREGYEVIEGIPSFPVERWAHPSVSGANAQAIKQAAESGRVPVMVGMTTASLMDEAAAIDSTYLEAAVRRAADRWVVLYRPELYRVSADARPEERDLVCLTGSSPQWWDTRCAKLRYHPGSMSFATVT